MLYPHCGHAAAELSARKSDLEAATERVKRSAVRSLVSTAVDPSDYSPDHIGEAIATVIARQKGLRRDP